MSDLVLRLVFSTAGCVAALAVGVVYLWRSGASRSARWWFAGTMTAYAAASVPAVPLALMQAYAARYTEFTTASASPPAVIVLLGAGTNTIQTGSGRIAVPSEEGARRTFEALRVFGLLPDSEIISSGGSRLGTSMPSSVAMRDALVAHGVPAARIVLESGSLTTRDEVVRIEPLLRARHAERFVLVTGAAHMRRAEAAFRAVGLHPVPAAAPVPHFHARDRFVPRAEGLRLTHALLHEWIGLAYYAVRGWAR